MPRHFPTLIILLIALCHLPAAAQDQPAAATPTSTAQTALFQPGQKIYVVAQRQGGQTDSYIEKRLQKAFEKQKHFQLAPSANEAKLVFLAHSEYDALASYNSKDIRRLSAFVLSSEQYAQSKGDYEAVKGAALWTGQVKSSPVPLSLTFSESLSEKLVVEFHRQLSSLQNQPVPLATSGSSAVAATAPPLDGNFKLQSGQKVYIAAYRLNGQADTGIERRLQEAFEKQKLFGVAQKQSEADFVFLVYANYVSGWRDTQEHVDNLSWFALTPSQYAALKGNLDALREAAQWQGVERVGRVISIPEGLSGRLARKFHDDFRAGRLAARTEAAPINANPSAPAATTPAADGGATAPFKFQSGQTVYIAGYRFDGTAEPSLEISLSKAFEQQKFFNVTREPSKADFIFLAYVESRVDLLGFALTPAQYARLKGDLEALREGALWQGREKMGTWFNPARLSEKLVQKFHDELQNTPAPSRPELAAALPTTEANTNKPPGAGKPLNFQAGQAIYIAAYQITGAAAPTLEPRLQKAFEEQKFFKIAPKPSAADVIFLVYGEGGWGFTTNLLDYLSGFALTPEQYARLKGDLNAIREEAAWKERVRMSQAGFHNVGGLIDKLVRKFHDDLRGVSPAKAATSTANPDASARAAIAAPRDAAAARKLEEEYDKALEKGQFEKALLLAQAVLEFKEQQFGVEHVELILPLAQLAAPYLARQDYARAEALLARALTIAEKKPGEPPVQTAAVLSQTAALQAERGDFARATPLQRRALEILEKSSKPDEAQVAAALNDLALFELAQGDASQAEARLTGALALQEKKLGKNAREVADTLRNLATVYFIRGDDGRAQPLYERALAIFDGKHRGAYKFFSTLEKVGTFPSVGRNTDDFTISAHRFQERGIHITDTLNNLAVIYLRRGKLKEAGELLQRALEIESRAYGTHHPDLARTQDNQALLHRARGATAAALEARRIADQIIETDLRRNLLAGSERQKQAYLARFAERTDAAISLHLLDAPGNADAAKIALTALLRYKGRALEAMTDMLSRLRRNADARTQTLLDQYAELRTRLSALQLDGATAANAEELRARAQQLEDDLEKIENEIAKLSVGFRAELRAINYETVQARIPAGSALIEFARYRPDHPRQTARSAPHYAVYVLFTKGPPRAVDLGAAEPIEQAIAAWRLALRDPGNAEVKRLGRSVDEKVMQPVRALLDGTRTVLLSPDGALNLIPFAALVDEQDKYLAEQYSFTYLTSGRDLLRLQDQAPSRTEPLLLADPDFGVKAATPNALTTSGSVFAQAVFTPLPGTAEEAQALQTLLPSARTLTGAQATETALKQTVAPHLLHIATHGFFLNAQPDSPNGAAAQRLLLQQKSAATAVVPAALPTNPLLRSGLGLAGANLRRSDAEDGILTAFEAAALNLLGTKLVVLSACDTGVGEVKNGEGVYGLRRALVLAGAETQVMSLWPVSDQGTRDLMIAYYKALEAGKGRSAAMQEVQLQLLQSAARQHPYYWASFIVSGEWANLEGQRQ